MGDQLMAFKLTKVNQLPGQFISVVTDNIPEPAENPTNLWYTDDRADSRIAEIRNTLPTIQDKHFYTIGEIEVKQGDLYWHILADIEILSCQILVKEAPVGNKIQINVVKNQGSDPSDVLYDLDITPLSNSAISNTAPVSLSAGDFIRIDILQRGSTTSGSDLVVSFAYRTTF